MVFGLETLERFLNMTTTTTVTKILWLEKVILFLPVFNGIFISNRATIVALLFK